MTIVLFGEDLFTATVLKSLVLAGHKIAAVVCPIYKENLEYKSLQHAAEKNNIPFIQTGDINADEIKKLLFRTVPDLIVTVHLKKILHPSVYSMAARGAINVHPSLLPKYRGLSPQQQALINGDSVTGVTIHFIDEKPDTGDIILQEPIDLDDKTSIFDLQMKMLSVYKYLISKAVAQLEANQFIKVRQDEIHASWYGSLKRSDRQIDLQKSTWEIYNLIRAVSKPYKGAFRHGTTIWASSIPDGQIGKRLMDQYPAEGIYFAEDQLILRLKDGILLSEDFEKNEY